MAMTLFQYFAVVAALTFVSTATTPNNNDGTFTNPSAQVRPFFRYWLPDAGVDPAVVASDIRSAAEVGAGGIEFLAYYGYGGEIGGTPPGSDWVTYGFGSASFQHILQVALEAAKENSMLVDIALGPNQGQGVPASSDDDGIQWDLVPFVQRVSVNQTTERIPGWGEGQLVACVVASADRKTNVSMVGGPGSLSATPSQDSYIRLVLDERSLQDMTQNVSSDGILTIPSRLSSHELYLFSFYQKRTLHKALEVKSNRTDTILANGSFVVDHFSKEGARTVINYWNDHIFTEDIRQLLVDVGNYGWEDSMEFQSNISWTPKLPDAFYHKFGYNLGKFLPLVMFGQNNIMAQPGNPGLVKAIFKNSETTNKYINDYRSALADGYGSYLTTLREWLNQDLGLQYSTQMPPECESLQWKSNIDGYRQFAGAAYLAGKKVVSNEMGAVQSRAYSLTIPELLQSVNKAFAGGVNRVVLHGQPYSGDYYGTTWPGSTPFQYVFADMYSPKQPSWMHGFNEAMSYISRAQFILRQGIPKFDVAFVNKDSATDPNWATKYGRDDLLDAGRKCLQLYTTPSLTNIPPGYIYTYLSPDNLELPEASVHDGVFASQGPGIKTIIVTQDVNITVSAIHKLKDYAAKGLPVILSGGSAQYYPTSNDGGVEAFRAGLQELADSRGVRTTRSADIAKTLVSHGISPRIRVQTNGTWHTTWREEKESQVDYAFIFCDGGGAQGKIRVTTDKFPYLFNAWTGERQPLVQYKRRAGDVVIPLTLKANQTTILAFSAQPWDDIYTPSIHIEAAPSSVLGYHVDHKGGVVAQMAHTINDAHEFLLSDNSTRTVPSTSAVQCPFQIRNWTLTAERWEAPENMQNASTIASIRNTTHHIPSLLSWTEIPDLVNASGIGYYSSQFAWHHDYQNQIGAYITFSRILHAVQVFVNGEKIAPIDPTAGTADIGAYLRDGENELLVVVPTTMWNYLRSIFPKITESGAPPLLSRLAALIGLPDIVPNGLVGEVSITPYLGFALGI
ncbi:Glycoside hydrolase family 2 N-terminal [Penicillium expansum]|nr:Glycoside hydrolase family 2 N-terminal [Penicillium expansum]